MIISDVVCRSIQYTNRLNYGVSHDLDDLALLGAITIGDLHGNTVKLLHFLLRHGVIQFREEAGIPEGVYARFVDLYEEIGKLTLGGVDSLSRDIRNANRLINHHQGMVDKYKARLKEDLSEDQREEITVALTKSEERLNKQNIEKLGFDIELAKVRKILPVVFEELMFIISFLEVSDPTTLVQLIGDVFADRGSNDYLTLKILNILKRGDVKVTEIISNHSNEFIERYESEILGKAPKILVGGSTRASLTGLEVLLAEGLVTREELNDLIETTYKPSLRAIDYTLTDNGIRFRSHAPVNFSVIRSIADRLHVVYDDSTPIALAHTIDKINIQFSKIVSENRVHDYCTIPDEELGTEELKNLSDDLISRYPLAYVLWNRWSAEKDENPDARPALVNGYPVYYDHGHDDYQSPLLHVTNFDTPCGKETREKQAITQQDAIEYIDTHPDENDPLRIRAQQHLLSIQQYKVLNGKRPILAVQDLTPEMIEAEYAAANPAPVNPPTAMWKRRVTYAAVFATIGFVIGALIGVGLVMSGAFAPFGVGILGILGLAGTAGGGFALISGGLGTAMPTLMDGGLPVDYAQSVVSGLGSSASMLNQLTTIPGASSSGAATPTPSSSEPAPAVPTCSSSELVSAVPTCSSFEPVSAGPTCSSSEPDPAVLTSSSFEQNDSQQGLGF